MQVILNVALLVRLYDALQCRSYLPNLATVHTFQ